MSFSTLPSHDMSWFNWADCSDHPVRAKMPFNEPNNATQSDGLEKYPKFCGTLYPLSPHLYPSWCRGTASRQTSSMKIMSMTMIWELCAPDLDITAMPQLDASTKTNYEVVHRRWAPIHPSHNFCAIVAFCRRAVFHDMCRSAIFASFNKWLRQLMYQIRRT